MNEKKNDLGLEFDFDLSDEAIAVTGLDDYSFLTSEAGSFKSTADERYVQSRTEDLLNSEMQMEFEGESNSGNLKGDMQTAADVSQKSAATSKGKRKSGKGQDTKQTKRDNKGANTVDQEEKKKGAVTKQKSFALRS